MSRYCILHIMATNFFGGPEKQIVQHCASMNRKLWRMVVCSFLEGKARNELLQKASEHGLETRALHTACSYNPLVILELANLIQCEKPDIIVTHGYRPLIICLLLRLFNKKRIITYSRGFTEENLKIRLFEKLYRICMRFSNLIVAVSEGHKQVLTAYRLEENKIHSVRNAVAVVSPLINQPEKLRKDVADRLDIPKEATIVVCAGRLSPEKGHRFLLEAIGKIGSKMKDTFFVFCGDGPCKKDLEKQAQELGISKHCRFPGFRRDLPEIFRVMDLMILPSLSEGLPNVVLEAFACAKPVVATAIGGVPEVVEDGVNGVLVPPARPDLLADAVVRCLAEPNMMLNMGKAGYHKVKSEFTVESQTQKLEEIYRQVLSGTEGFN